MTIGRVRLLEQGLGVAAVDADEHAALAAGGDGHVAADEEGEPAEHLLLADTLDRQVRQHLANPVGELLVGSRGCASRGCGEVAGIAYDDSFTRPA